jgi:hypothetical protein
VAQVEEHRAGHVTSCLDLGRLRAGDDVARRELERVRRVPRHEALAVPVDEIAAFPTACLGDQDAARIQRRRMELHELHVLERNAGVQRHGHPVAVARVGVRRHAVDPPHPPRGEHDRATGHELQTTADEIPADDPDATSVLDHEPPCEVLLVHVHRALLHPLHELLVEHVDEHVARDVGRVDRARRSRGAERSLREPPLVVSREHATPVLELVDVAGRLAREDLDRVLVSEVVGALHGVERVRLRTVFPRVAEGCVDAAFRSA